MLDVRVQVAGKYFVAGGEKWFARGFCYGPFAPNSVGEFLPEATQLRKDFAQLHHLGANCVRVYHVPTREVLDIASKAGMRIFVDVPWQKHRCFFEDWEARREARRAVRETALAIGDHPGLFAISVGNEIPADVIRYHGVQAVSRFISELIDEVKQVRPDCLTTYVNFPTTEFLTIAACDFHCFNVYLHDQSRLGAYLDRLQHLAGNRPLLLGEYGIDAIRQGEEQQASMLGQHLRQVFRRGLAGSFIFSFTDDWYTGGQQIQDWSFGVTTRDRTPRIAAATVEEVWRCLPERLRNPPRVSVVVCSYNGGATLCECLMSLMKLDYPNYEVILVDDGSTDDTRAIAAQFPQVIYHRQHNQGLSVARNVGAQLATGDIVAYTDSDCVADEHWLYYLVAGMRDQKVDAIGGPNITPPSDGWVAKCVAASPGNPSHVMFDDQCAEHVPGCNMAFKRTTLLSIGGFDPQFRQAGDDVDVCWRLLDDGYRIGYAAAAMVWHHRRGSVRAYYRQQKGYGRAEAMLSFKHPQRFAESGRLRFDGVIYGDGKAGLPLVPAKIYHGRFGSALFQTIYQSRDFRFHARATSLEWHCCSGLLLSLSTMMPVLVVASALMWMLTVGSIAMTMREMSLSLKYPRWCRWLIFWLHLSQPIVRGLHRNGYCLRNKRLPHGLTAEMKCPSPPKRISAAERELYWETTNGRGREDFLDALVSGAKRSGWPGDFYGCWVPWDVELIADLWHHVPIRTATEELGWPRRFTRVRWSTKPTRLADASVAGVCIWCAFAVMVNALWAMVLGLSCSMLLVGVLALSRVRCLHAAGRLIWQAAEEAQLTRQRSEQPSRTDFRPAEPQRAGRAKSRTPVCAADSGS